MPQEVILRISQIGCAQGMPSRITYMNRRGDEISNDTIPTKNGRELVEKWDSELMTNF